MRLTERPRAVRSHDDGFTLVELIVTVAIMGVIVSALTGVVISYLKTTVDTQSRLTESQDVQLAAVYWQRDVASIGVRSYDPVDKSFPLEQSVDVAPSCSLPSGTPVVTLAWSTYASLDSTETPATVTVTYVAQPDNGGGYDLRRVRCAGSTVTSSIEVAHSLDALPVRSCDVSCTGSGGAVPTVVRLQLSVLDPEGHGGAPSATTLSGVRRQA